MEKQGPLSGKLVANRYLLGELLGSGGMGAVYKAQDIRLSRLVAMKVMSPTSPVSEADLQHFTGLFQTEALRLASLKHTAIPHIYDHFEEATHWFLAMELIEGETLNAYLKRQGGQLQVDKVLKIGLQLADVLNYLHLRQPPIIFRDLKPANIMISTNSQIFLIDFGIARVFTPGKSQDTFVFLSQGYAAPEQHGTAQTTVRSDIYSLGATLHHLLSGTHPATSPFLFASLSIQQPTQLASLIAQMVALDPANRSTSMAEVKEALQRLIDQTATAGLSTSTASMPITPLPPASLTSTQPAQSRAGTVPLMGVQPPLARSSSVSPSPPIGRLTSSAIGRPPIGTTFLTHESSGLALAWSPDGQRIASDQIYGRVQKDGGRGIDIWDSTTGETFAELTLDLRDDYSPRHTVAIIWSPDGKYLVAGVLVGDKNDRRSITEIWEASSKGYSPYTSRFKFTTEIWEARRGSWSGKQQRNGYRYFDAPYVIRWSPDLLKVAIVGSEGLVVASLSGRKRIVHRAESVQHIPYYRGGGADMRGWETAKISLGTCNHDVVAWSPDGTRIAWGAGNEIPVWDVHHPQREGHHLLTYREHRSIIVAVKWSSDGGQITSRSEDSSERVWDASNGQTLAKGFSSTVTVLVEGEKQFTSLAEKIREKNAISPDGALKAVPTNEGIEIQTVTGSETVFVYRGHFSDKTAQHWSPEVKALSWSPDGTRIAFARFDGRIYVWQAI